MSIPEGYKANFTTLLNAAIEEEIALMECTDKVTGKPVIVICAMHFENKEYVMTPIAKMFDGNPYEELNPPN